MDAVEPSSEALLRVVDDLIVEHRLQALEIAAAWERDHPMDRASTENLMVVLQDLEMLVALRNGLSVPTPP